MTRGTNAAKPSFVVVCSCINAIDVSVLEFLLPLIFLLFVFVLHVRVLVEVFADFVVAHKVGIEVRITGHLVNLIPNFVVVCSCRNAIERMFVGSSFTVCQHLLKNSAQNNPRFFPAGSILSYQCLLWLSGAFCGGQSVNLISNLNRQARPTSCLYL